MGRNFTQASTVSFIGRFGPSEQLRVVVSGSGYSHFILKALANSGIDVFKAFPVDVAPIDALPPQTNAVVAKRTNAAPSQITYGPERRGKGGKVKRW